MNANRLVQIGGVINLLFAVFHLSFWKLFDWQQSLASLSSEDRAIMQVLNIHTAYVLAVFSILSLVFPNEMSDTKLGRIFAKAIAGFWVLRAVNQAVFWGLSFADSWIIIAVCLAIAALYIIPSTHKV
ncbi:MAG: hypothetical protein MUO77_05550 [Anaerolineales bacterium]|nr:hypothetical protein [Anaerolineales bacterium]